MFPLFSRFCKREMIFVMLYCTVDYGRHFEHFLIMWSVWNPDIMNTCSSSILNCLNFDWSFGNRGLELFVSSCYRSPYEVEKLHNWLNCCKLNVAVSGCRCSFRHLEVHQGELENRLRDSWRIWNNCSVSGTPKVHMSCWNPVSSCGNFWKCRVQEKGIPYDHKHSVMKWEVDKWIVKRVRLSCLTSYVLDKHSVSDRQAVWT